MAVINDDSPTYPPYPIVAALTVQEIERLAKAGVKVDFKDISNRIRSDPEPDDRRSLLRPFLDRWHRFQEIKAGENRDHWPTYQPPPFQISVCGRGDKVFVFIVPHDPEKEPQTLTDDARFYPSDALMAKIHLMLETQ